MTEQSPTEPESSASISADISGGASWASRHPMAVYSAARLVLFAAPFALLSLFMEFLWALLIAFFFSAIASIFLLRKQRDAFGTSLATRADRANEKMAERSAAEDEWDDVQRDADGSDQHTS